MIIIKTPSPMRGRKCSVTILFFKLISGNSYLECVVGKATFCLRIRLDWIRLKLNCSLHPYLK